MLYLKRHLPLKEQPRRLLKNAQSAIIVVKNYKNTKTQKLKNNYKIARYAVGRDYHFVITEKLKEFEDHLRKCFNNIECYSGVDSRPIAERSFAIRSGIGFLGKNSMVIRPGLGSYFFIGIILTNARFPIDKPIKKNCGDCHKCIDACPTGAICKNNQNINRPCL